MPSCLLWHARFQWACPASSLEMKPQISVEVLEEYCFIITFYGISEYDCRIFRVDVLPLVAAVLQALLYLIYNYLPQQYFIVLMFNN